MSSSLRLLIHELLFEAPRKTSLKWKFRPEKIIEGDYNEAWTGVEEISGLLFRIKTEVEETQRGSKTYLAVILSAYLSSDSRISFDHVADVVPLDDSVDLIERFQLWAQQLRKSIASTNFDTNYQIKHHLTQRFDWRPGRWVVPGLDHRVPGDRVDFGPFKVLLSRDFDQMHKIYVIGRQDFRWSGPVEGWILNKVPKSQNFNDQKSFLEKSIKPIYNFDRADDEKYLADVFENFEKFLGMEPIQ